MSTISYQFDIKAYAKAYVNRDYDSMKQSILSMDNPTFCLEEKNKRYGYVIKKNEDLNRLYGFPFFVVDFFFSEIDTLSNEEEDALLDRLICRLRDDVNQQKGYYNLRLPAHITGLMKSYNRYISHSMMCGGTVSYVWDPSFKGSYCDQEGKSFIADQAYFEAHREDLIFIAKSAFERYQGQYHISPVTCDLAGSIYTQWIEKSFLSKEQVSLRVFEKQGKPAGFFTVGEEGPFHQIVLSAVSKEFHGQGIYDQLFQESFTHAKDEGKGLIIGTHLDNYIVQGVWNKYGLKPFHTFYNFHWDNR